MKIHEVGPKQGSRRTRKRVGRGRSSGHGKTSGRGENGAKSRSGYSRKVGFEGGQMPLVRRIPKRGFKNPFRTNWAEVNLDQLTRFDAGSSVDPELLASVGLIKGRYDKVVVMGRGELSVALNIKVHRFTSSAAAKIAEAGGTAEVLG